MNNTVNLAKVKAAVAKYASRRINTQPEVRDKTPVDAALRKPLKGSSVVCRAGFNHPNFLHGIDA